MDYTYWVKINGIKLRKGQNTLYVSGIFAHNNSNFGNFLWGAGMNALGFGEGFTKFAANIHNLFSPLYGFSFKHDSTDDQLSIHLGYQRKP